MAGDNFRLALALANGGRRLMKGDHLFAFIRLSSGVQTRLPHELRRIDFGTTLPAPG